MMHDVTTGRRSGWIGEMLAGLHGRTVLHTRERPDRPLLDSIRWLSAAAVALGHGAGLVVARAPHARGVFDPLSFLVDLRGPAVLLFFVISGYLVGGGVLVRGAAFRWRRYAVTRFARIYIVLVPAVLLIAALDWSAHLIDPASPVYGGHWQSDVAGNHAAITRYLPLNWLVTLLSIESWVAPPIGTGDPLWSLGYEWVYYFTFPLLALPFARRSLWWPLAPVAAIALAMTLAGGKFQAMYMGIWVAGAYARVLTEHARVPRWVQFGGVALAIAGLLLGHLVHQQLSTLFGLGAAIALARFGAGERAIFPRLDRRLADRSYSLYVTHFSVMMWLVFFANRAGWVGPAGLPLGATSLALVAALGVAAALVAWAFGRAFEDRTAALRDWLLRPRRKSARA